MSLFSSKKRRAVCVVGLDGVPFSLLRRLARDGVLPATAERIARGRLQKMTVTLPEISAVSWTSFMTGAGPATHGIFGFTDLVPGGRDTRFPSFRDVKAPTFWDRLGQKGKRCVVINQPATYPARPIPGVLVSGFVAVDLRKACFPARHFPALERANYQLDVDTARARKDHAYLLEALHSTLEGRRRAVELFWPEDWDYFQIVVTGTDRLHHYLWRAIEDATDPLHGDALDYYRKVDAFVDEMAERFRKKVGGGSSEAGPDGFFMLSDHGFTGIRKEFRLNAWLRAEGFQARKERGAGESGESAPRLTLGDLAPETCAFALDPNRIYFNRKDRFADGCVNPAEVPALAEEISEKLRGLRCDGEPVVQKAIPRDEIYRGPLADHAPDLIALTRPGFDAKGALDPDEVFAETDLQGMHTWDDAFFWSAEETFPEKSAGDLNIADLAALFEARL